MSAVTVHGRTLVPGRVRANALVCSEEISGWGGVGVDGTIIETSHPQRGASFAGRVLVIPGAKGSSGWSGQFHLCRTNGTAPAAIVTSHVNSKLAVGLVALGVPAVRVGSLQAFADDCEVELVGDGSVVVRSGGREPRAP